MNANDFIPACSDCAGDGCPTCFGTGLTAEDCDFKGLALTLLEDQYRALHRFALGLRWISLPGPHG